MGLNAQYKLSDMTLHGARLRLEPLSLCTVKGQKLEYGFALICRDTNEVLGTSYLIPHDAKSIEIGKTYINPVWRRTFVHTEAKLIMLSYAFEQLNYQRVFFKVDLTDFYGQACVKRLGARFEWEVRNFTPYSGPGTRKDYKTYSLSVSEWPHIKANLLSKVQTHSTLIAVH